MKKRTKKPNPLILAIIAAVISLLLLCTVTAVLVVNGVIPQEKMPICGYFSLAAASLTGTVICAKSSKKTVHLIILCVGSIGVLGICNMLLGGEGMKQPLVPICILTGSMLVGLLLKAKRRRTPHPVR